MGKTKSIIRNEGRRQILSEEKGMNWSLQLAVVLFGTGNLAFIVGLMMAGKIPAAAGATSAAWLLGLALIGIRAGLIMLRRGDTLLGTITLFLSTILCVGAAFSGLIRMFATGDPISKTQFCQHP